MPSEVTQNLVGRLLERDERGLQKYGVSLDRKDLTIEQWLDHQTEELLDGAGYAQAAKREIAELRAKLEACRRVLRTIRPEIGSPALAALIDEVLPTVNQTPA